MKTGMIVTPTVVAVAQQMFGCDSLAGAPLENQSTGQCWASHWEERLFNDEIMSAVAS